MTRAHGYIKRITSYGGDEEGRYSSFDDAEMDFNAWLDEQPKVSGVTLYRGYRLEHELAEAIMENAILEPLHISELFHPGFTTSPLRAGVYCNEMGSYLGQKYLFILETTGKYMVDISKYSVYPEEGEHQPVSQAQWLVTKVRPTGSYIEVQMKEI